MLTDKSHEQLRTCKLFILSTLGYPSNNDDVLKSCVPEITKGSIILRITKDVIGKIEKKISCGGINNYSIAF